MTSPAIMSEAMRKNLAQPFDPKQIRTKPGRGGSRPLTFISHGLITARLNEVDPAWSNTIDEVYTYADAQGRTHCEGVLLTLTVGGVSRQEMGGPQRQDGFTNECKNAASDALKRAAMRFGVALSMWDSLVDAEGDEDAEGEVVDGEFLDGAGINALVGQAKAAGLTVAQMNQRSRAQFKRDYQELTKEQARILYRAMPAAQSELVGAVSGSAGDDRHTS